MCGLHMYGVSLVDHSHNFMAEFFWWVKFFEYYKIVQLRIYFNRIIGGGLFVVVDAFQPKAQFFLFV